MLNQRHKHQAVGYRNYFIDLETRLGMLLLPIQRDATGPRHIVTSDALHVDLARQAAIAIYRENRCLGMESQIRLFPTLDALGRLRSDIEESNLTDTASIEFLELLGKATLAILGKEKNEPS